MNDFNVLTDHNRSDVPKAQPYHQVYSKQSLQLQHDIPATSNDEYLPQPSTLMGHIPHQYSSDHHPNDEKKNDERSWPSLSHLTQQPRPSETHDSDQHTYDTSDSDKTFNKTSNRTFNISEQQETEQNNHLSSVVPNGESATIPSSKQKLPTNQQTAMRSPSKQEHSKSNMTTPYSDEVEAFTESETNTNTDPIDHRESIITSQRNMNKAHKKTMEYSADINDITSKSLSEHDDSHSNSTDITNDISTTVTTDTETFASSSSHESDSNHSSQQHPRLQQHSNAHNDNFTSTTMAKTSSSDQSEVLSNIQNILPSYKKKDIISQNNPTLMSSKQHNVTLLDDHHNTSTNKETNSTSPDIDTNMSTNKPNDPTLHDNRNDDTTNKEHTSILSQSSQDTLTKKQYLPTQPDHYNDPVTNPQPVTNRQKVSIVASHDIQQGSHSHTHVPSSKNQPNDTPIPYSNTKHSDSPSTEKTFISTPPVSPTPSSYHLSKVATSTMSNEKPALSNEIEDSTTYSPKNNMMMQEKNDNHSTDSSNIQSMGTKSQSKGTKSQRLSNPVTSTISPIKKGHDSDAPVLDTAKFSASKSHTKEITATQATHSDTSLDVPHTNDTSTLSTHAPSSTNFTHSLSRITPSHQHNTTQHQDNPISLVSPTPSLLSSDKKTHTSSTPSMDQSPTPRLSDKPTPPTTVPIHHPSHSPSIPPLREHTHIISRTNNRSTDDIHNNPITINISQLREMGPQDKLHTVHTPSPSVTSHTSDTSENSTDLRKKTTIQTTATTTSTPATTQTYDLSTSSNSIQHKVTDNHTVTGAKNRRDNHIDTLKLTKGKPSLPSSTPRTDNTQDSSKANILAKEALSPPQHTAEVYTKTTAIPSKSEKVPIDQKTPHDDSQETPRLLIHEHRKSDILTPHSDVASASAKSIRTQSIPHTTTTQTTPSSTPNHNIVPFKTTNATSKNVVSKEETQKKENKEANKEEKIVPLKDHIIHTSKKQHHTEIKRKTMKDLSYLIRNNNGEKQSFAQAAKQRSSKLQSSASGSRTQIHSDSPKHIKTPEPMQEVTTPQPHLTPSAQKPSIKTESNTTSIQPSMAQKASQLHRQTRLRPERRSSSLHSQTPVKVSIGSLNIMTSAPEQAAEAPSWTFSPPLTLETFLQEGIAVNE